MTTNPKDKNALSASGQLTPTSTDTNTPAKYEVTLHFTQCSTATVVIEANSLAEAEAMADELHPDEVADWNPTDGDLWVESVEQYEGGQDNE